MGIPRVLEQIDRAQQRHRAPGFVVGVLKKYSDDNGGNLTTLLAYASFVTIFPLLLLLLTALSIVLADEPSWRERVLRSAFGELPLVGSQFARNIHVLKRSSPFGLTIGLLGLAYGSTRMAQTGLYAMTQIWDIPRAATPKFAARLARSLEFLAVLGLGLLLTTVAAGFGTFGTHGVAAGIGAEILAVGVNIATYLGGFRVLTPKEVPTRSLVPGAVAGAVAWTVLQAVGGYVMGHDVRGSSQLYGTFGVVLGLLAWLGLAALITMYAAEANVVLSLRLWPRALLGPPRTAADDRSAQLVAVREGVTAPPTPAARTG
ncbi:MAG TPA: YhjD/YihY/BrkB family envelope integrity protein [Acidimicrobiales bacterium]|nr:YhjD/YihY/BrkB family envelope integrity protein [Acidimicrobiales bacterium]